MAFSYLLYDVFTGTALSGNQLAVFPDARAVPAGSMQRIARELNLSETTFVLPATLDGTDARMRIFTPQVEMPMAGHPTIGSTFALAQTGAIAAGRARFVFELNVGPVPVDLEWDGSRMRFAWMTQAAPVFGRVADAAAVADALGLLARDVRDDLPLEEVSCGVPYLIVPLRDKTAIDRAVPDPARLARIAAKTGSAVPLYLFAPASFSDASDGAPTWYCRMFAPGLGVLEDPATGSAAGPLGCYLVQHTLLRGAAASAITIVQGVAMGRPSRMHVAVSGEPSTISGVKVGGEAVFIGRGELFL